MKSSTGMFEIAMFLALIGVCLTVAFTALHYTQREVISMQDVQDVRQIQQVYDGGIRYSYLSRPGAYLDPARLAFSAGTASADSRAKIRIFGNVIQAYDMYTMNISATSMSAPLVYDSLKEWWEGFISSPQYNCIYGGSCLGAVNCPNAQAHTFDFTDNVAKRTFDPTHITANVAGFEMANPTTFEECKFKLRVVEAGTDPKDGKPLLEYRVFIFLGSLVKQTSSSAPQIEYRWYECVKGAAGQPWVVLQ